MSDTRSHAGPEPPSGAGPLAGAEPDTGQPVDDPTLSDHANPRWEDRGGPGPVSQSLTNPDGTPNVLPSSVAPESVLPEALDHGTLQDQAALVMDPEVSGDNIREGRGGGTPNPAAAEGGNG